MEPRTTPTVLIAIAAAVVGATVGAGVTYLSDGHQESLSAATRTTMAAPTTTQDPRITNLMQALNTASSPTLSGMAEPTVITTAGYICQIVDGQALPLGNTHNEQELNLLKQIQTGNLGMSPADASTFVDLVDANYCR